MIEHAFTRRAFLGAAAASPLLLSAVRPGRAAGITVGIIYVGPRDDYGWNQAHCGRRAGAEGDARRQGRRGGERAGDDRRRARPWSR